MNNELAVRQPMEYAMSLENLVRQAALVQEVMKIIMKPGEHYGVIPGTERRDANGKALPFEQQRKSLFKSGAEKLCMVFGLIPELRPDKIDLPGGHREYVITCNLVDRSGNVRGQGVGSASTLESKHRYRGFAGKRCPSCGSMTIKPSKKEYGGGYYCDAKGGGCKAAWKAGTKEATALDAISVVRAENQDPADQYNTVLKMAKKRALVDATLTATGASDIFAQDLEDLDDKIDDMDEAAAKSAPKTEQTIDEKLAAKAAQTAKADAPDRGF